GRLRPADGAGTGRDAPGRTGQLVAARPAGPPPAAPGRRAARGGAARPPAPARPRLTAQPPRPRRAPPGKPPNTAPAPTPPAPHKTGRRHRAHGGARAAGRRGTLHPNSQQEGRQTSEGMTGDSAMVEHMSGDPDAHAGFVRLDDGAMHVVEDGPPGAPAVLLI